MGMTAGGGWQWKDAARAIAGVTTAPSRTFVMLADNSRKHMIPVVMIFAASCVAEAFFSGWFVGIGMSVPTGLNAIAGFAGFMIAMFGAAAGFLITYAVITRVGNRWTERSVRFGTVLVVMTYAVIPPTILGGLLWILAPYPYSMAAEIWAVVLAVKGIKVIYGYGTAKSFGIFLLAALAGGAVFLSIKLVFESLGHGSLGLDLFQL